MTQQMAAYLVVGILCYLAGAFSYAAIALLKYDRKARHSYQSLRRHSMVPAIKAGIPPVQSGFAGSQQLHPDLATRERLRDGLRNLE